MRSCWFVFIAGRARPSRTRHSKGQAGRRLVKAAVVAIVVLAVPVPAASGHRSPCHTKHECPSDHATYRWKGQLCVARDAAERTVRFNRRVVYGGRVYYCHR